MTTNIKKCLKLKGKPAEIPDKVSLDLPVFFKEMGYKVGAEIGVYKGEFTREFCNVGLKMYGIDPWMAYDNYNKFSNNIKEYWTSWIYVHSRRSIRVAKKRLKRVK